MKRIKSIWRINDNNLLDMYREICVLNSENINSLIDPIIAKSFYINFHNSKLILFL